MDHAYGLEVPERIDEVCHPTRTALIVYDMQVGIVSQIAAGRSTVERVQEVLQAARDTKLRVFFTRHMSLPNEVAGVSQLRRAKAWQGVDRAVDTKPAFPRDSPQFQITPELAPLPSEAIVDKITMSAFARTYLDIALRDCGIKSFSLGGKRPGGWDRTDGAACGRSRVHPGRGHRRVRIRRRRRRRTRAGRAGICRRCAPSRQRNDHRPVQAFQPRPVAGVGTKKGES